MPKISIIIPVYNAEKTISACLNSIFNQTFSDFEVIVVNDGSTDNSLNILNNWSDKIKIFSQKQTGAPLARNFGFAKSAGEYVLFCDADIVLDPTMLEKMNKTLDVEKNIAFVYSSFKFGWKVFRLWQFDAEKLRQMPYIHTTSLIRREFFPGFDPALKKFQDWDLWLTILEKGESGLWLDEVLFTIKSGGTMSNWLPSFLYKLPWLKSVKKYNEAKKIITDKHLL